MASRQRVEQQSAYVLHSMPWRETSLIVELFSREHGRLPVVAKGARRPASAFRGVLMAFQPLLAGWSGAGEVRTLVRAEWCGGMRLLAGRALLCAYYLNELLVRLLPRDDPHPRLFDHYRDALLALAAGEPADLSLRRFEAALLAELGYLADLSNEADGGATVREGGRYVFIIDRGVLPASRGLAGLELAGEVLLDIASGAFARRETLPAAKQLFRMILAPHLGGQELQSRRVFTEFQDL